MTMRKPLKGKVALVMGVASEESIAWAIAQELTHQGARVILGYQFRFHSRIMQLAPTLPHLIAYERCDMLKDDEVKAFFAKIHVPIDIVVHAIAFAPARSFEHRVVQTKDEDFTTAMLTSAHSLAKLMNASRKHMPHGGSVIALSYLGGVRVAANYKVMGVAKAALEAYVRELAVDLGPKGIRVNAISAGPIRTLAASGIPDMERLLTLQPPGLADARQRDPGRRRAPGGLPGLRRRSDDHRPDDLRRRWVLDHRGPGHQQRAGGTPLTRPGRRPRATPG